MEEHSYMHRSSNIYIYIYIYIDYTFDLRVIGVQSWSHRKVALKVVVVHNTDYTSFSGCHLTQLPLHYRKLHLPTSTRCPVWFQK